MVKNLPAIKDAQVRFLFQEGVTIKWSKYKKIDQWSPVFTGDSNEGH